MLKSLFRVSEHLWYRVRGEIHTRIKSERAAVSAEYAILVVFIALVIIIGATALGIAINNKLNDAAETLTGE
jgi:pilus assembly protein Flp/PilA